MDFQRIAHKMAPFAGYTVYIGFSGGADSTALTLVLREIAPQLELKLKAVHFEHGIRGDASLNDAEWCEAFCSNRDIDFQRIDLKIDLESGNIEAAAREKRLEAWQQLVDAKPQSVIALGHHAGDLTENLMIRLCRGSNSSGLTALRFITKVGDLTFVHPLLEMEKSEITEFLKSDLITWREDATNTENNYTRNFFRNVVLPQIYTKLPYAQAGFRHAANALEHDADYLEHAAEEEFAKITGQESVSCEFWQAMHPAMLQRVLRLWLAEQQMKIIPDVKLIERFNRLVRLNDGENRLLPVRQGGFISFSAGECRIAPAATQAPEYEIIWDWQNSQLAWCDKKLRAEITAPGDQAEYTDAAVAFDAAHVPTDLQVSPWHDGDRLIPFGSETPVKLKKIFCDRKIPAEDKTLYPTIKLANGKIIWLAGLRRSNFAPVNSETNRIVKFYFE